MASRSSNYREELSSLSSSSVLPPITVQHVDNRTDDSVTPGHDQSDAVNHMLAVPSDTPDSRFESAELQKRLASPDCLQCQWEKEKRDRVAIRKMNEKRNSANKEQERPKEKVIKVPCALPEVSAGGQNALLQSQKKDTPQKELTKSKTMSSKASLRSKELHSSRSYLKLPEEKNKRLYNSWEGGLHKYHMEEDSDSDEEPVIFRFKLKDKIEGGMKKRRPKTPPKSPFRGAILAEIENRRLVKVKEAHKFSSHDQLVKGKPVVEETDELNQLSSERVHKHIKKQPEYLEKSQNVPQKKEFVDGMERGSQIFQKKASTEKIARPFLPEVENKPQVAKGRTVMRNPLAPVSVQQRLKPVVVLKSKLDDYSEAIREFLECIIEEQKSAYGERKPVPLDQSSESMVIYKDFDEIQHMKEMARAMKLGLANLNNQRSTNQFNFKSPGLAKGKSRIKKIGALDTVDGYSLPQRMSVGGQSIFVNGPQNTFITAPGGEDKENTATENNLYASASAPKEPSSKYTLYGSKTTMVPPNTPYERQRISTVGNEAL